MSEYIDEENIYSSVPEEAIREGEGSKVLLLQVLENNKGKFFPAKKLAEMSGYKTKGTQVELRKAITELIEIEGKPIVGNVKGFAYASCANMVRFYLEQLGQREMGLARRISKVQEIYMDMKQKEEN